MESFVDVQYCRVLVLVGLMLENFKAAFTSRLVSFTDVFHICLLKNLFALPTNLAASLSNTDLIIIIIILVHIAVAVVGATG